MSKSFKIYNATDLWQRDNSLPSVASFSQSLDNILGTKGIRLGTLTEITGLPGTGKTQLCLQLCASIQIPKALGGLNAEALYIDTNTNFTVCRFKEILSATLSRCMILLQTKVHIKVEDALKKLHYINAFGLEKFCAVIHKMAEHLAERPNIRLIIIDSITFPFKEGISAKQRTGLLFRQMAELQRLAVDKQIAVVVTNEISTRVGLAGGSAVGALGDAWAHRCGCRVLLSLAARHLRTALLFKTNDTASAVASFRITHAGIRDIE